MLKNGAILGNLHAGVKNGLLSSQKGYLGEVIPNISE
jgi:hypothetical protein